MTTVTQSNGAADGWHATTPSTILVPLDGGEELSARALDVGRRWARAFGASLLVIAVRGCDRAALMASFDDLGVPRALWRAVRARDDLVPAVVDVVTANARAAVCVATRARSPLVDLLADDVAQEILRAVEVPVVLVGPHCRTSALDGPIVVAHDGTLDGDAVLEPARICADALGVEPVLLHVRDAFVAEGSDVAATLHTCRERLGAGATLQLVRSSFPAGAIREYAHEVDACMLALSTRGRTDMLTASTGHTATWVVRESSCPVLVAHPPAIPTA
jgi:nucleotide-binding universal stress UspA family protein